MKYYLKAWYGSVQRIKALALKEFRQFKRDTLGVRLLIVLPILQMVIIGPALDREVRNIKWTMVDQDNSIKSKAVAAAIMENPRFIKTPNSENLIDVRNKMDQGEIAMAMIIPQDFSADVETSFNGINQGFIPHNPGHIQLLLDGQDAATAGVTAGYAKAIIQQWLGAEMKMYMQGEGKEIDEMIPVSTRDAILYNTELRSSWYMIPGLVVLLVTMVISLNTAFSIVKEKENGTLEQLLVTPVGTMEVVVGKAIPMFVIGIAEMIFALGVARLIFQIPMMGSYPLLFTGIVIFVASSVVLGLLVSSFVASQQQALFLLWFFMIFFALTGGVMMPWESMPMWTQHITEGNAVRHFLTILRAIFLRGAEFSFLWPEFLKLGLIAALELVIAWVLFRRVSA